MTTLRLFTDGAARGNPGPAGLGLVIEDTEGMRLWGGCRYIGTATNNQAEYMALIEGLRKAAEWRPDRIEVYMDSQLVVEQLAGRYRVVLAVDVSAPMLDLPAVAVRAPASGTSSAT